MYLSSVVDQQASLLRQYEINNYVSLVSFSILYYDYILTFPMEWERFWKTANLSWAFVLYMANRYLTVFGQVPVIVLYFFPLTEVRCRHLQSYHQYLEIFTQALVAALLVMRTYALCDRSGRVLFALLALVAVGGGVGLWAIITSPSNANGSTSEFLFPGCDTSLSSGQANRLACAWGAMLFLDTVIFGMTFIKAIQHGRTWQGGTLRIMLRDGTLYFGVLVAVNVANIVSFITFSPLLRGLTTTLTNVLSSTLISRLMLNLRDPNLRRMPGMTTSVSMAVNTRQNVDTVVFAAQGRLASYGSDDTEISEDTYELSGTSTV